MWNNRLYNVLFALRIVTPFFVFQYPVSMMILSIILDSADGGIACQGVMKVSDYQRIDKVLDLWWLVFLLIFAYMHLPGYFLILFCLFGYRLIGELIFLKTGKRWLLLAFPNFFEYVFYFVYAASLLYLDPLVIWIGILWVLVVKMWHEYLLHIKNFSVRRLLGMKVAWLKE